MCKESKVIQVAGYSCIGIRFRNAAFCDLLTKGKTDPLTFSQCAGNLKFICGERGYLRRGEAAAMPLGQLKYCSSQKSQRS